MAHETDAATADAIIHAHLKAGRHRLAFEAVVPSYRDRVFRLSLSILRDATAAEDAAQDVFLRLWKALPGYNGSAALSTWIYAITRNTCISLLRKRRPLVSLDEPLFADDDNGAGLQLAAPEHDDSAVASVEKLLGSLPARYRQAVVLFYMEDKSYDQTAAALELPLGTVKALLHRARKRLIELTREAA
jgi:RNA polymerase sigma-70 factor, ECF subfamily